MFRSRVRSEEMKRYTLQMLANARFVKDRIFARALQCYLSYCQKVALDLTKGICKMTGRFC